LQAVLKNILVITNTPRHHHPCAFPRASVNDAPTGETVHAPPEADGRKNGAVGATGFRSSVSPPTAAKPSAGAHGGYGASLTVRVGQTLCKSGWKAAVFRPDL